MARPMTLGSPLYALLLLVALKTAIDVRAHVAERRKFGAQGTPSPLQAADKNVLPTF